VAKLKLNTSLTHIPFFLQRKIFHLLPESQTTLTEGVKVRVKNKGSQAHKSGPKRFKYQAPQKEHPFTTYTKS